jgi:uncharacterized protein (TIGR02246 family)
MKRESPERHVSANDEQQIRELVATWMSATEAGDVETVLGLMADDVVFLVAGQPPFGKQRFAEMARPPAGAPKPRFKGHSVIEEIQVFGEWAFMRTRLRVEVAPPGGEKTIARAGHTLSMLRKSGGRWLLARDANLLVTVDN